MRLRRAHPRGALFAAPHSDEHTTQLCWGSRRIEEADAELTALGEPLSTYEEEQEPPPSGCSATGGAPTWLPALLAAVLARRRLSAATKDLSHQAA